MALYRIWPDEYKYNEPAGKNAYPEVCIIRGTFPTQMPLLVSGEDENGDVVDVPRVPAPFAYILEQRMESTEFSKEFWRSTPFFTRDASLATEAGYNYIVLDAKPLLRITENSELSNGKSGVLVLSQDDMHGLMHDMHDIGIEDNFLRLKPEDVREADRKGYVLQRGAWVPANVTIGKIWEGTDRFPGLARGRIDVREFAKLVSEITSKEKLPFYIYSHVLQVFLNWSRLPDGRPTIGPLLAGTIGNRAYASDELLSKSAATGSYDLLNPNLDTSLVGLLPDANKGYGFGSKSALSSEPASGKEDKVPSGISGFSVVRTPKKQQRTGSSLYNTGESMALDVRVDDEQKPDENRDDKYNVMCFELPICKAVSSDDCSYIILQMKDSKFYLFGVDNTIYNDEMEGDFLRIPDETVVPDLSPANLERLIRMSFKAGHKSTISELVSSFTGLFRKKAEYTPDKDKILGEFEGRIRIHNALSAVANDWPGNIYPAMDVYFGTYHAEKTEIDSYYLSDRPRILTITKVLWNRQTVPKRIEWNGVIIEDRPAPNAMLGAFRQPVIDYLKKQCDSTDRDRLEFKY